jgi:hypothetical protein
MEQPRPILYQAQWLLRIGVGLILGAALLGLADPHLTVPRVALSTHLVALQGIFPVVAGLLCLWVNV